MKKVKGIFVSLLLSIIAFTLEPLPRAHAGVPFNYLTDIDWGELDYTITGICFCRRRWRIVVGVVFQYWEPFMLLDTSREANYSAALGTSVGNIASLNGKNKSQDAADFSESNFPLAFNHIRNPVEYQYTLTEKPGWAGLAGCSTSLSDAASPTFAGVRLQHVEATVTVKMDFSPTKEGEEAGITIYLDNKHYYSLSVIKSGKKSGFQVHKKAGSIEMKTPYSTHSKQISFLRLQISNTEIRFLVSVDGQVFNELETAEAKMLYSPQFTGAYVGIYATGNGNESKTKAWFDYFEYTPEK